MTVYQLLIFFHVLGAVGVFVALALEASSLARLRRAETPGDARDALRGLAVPGRLGPVAMLAALASGAWMMAVSWGHQAWIVTSLIALVGMGAAGGGVTGRRLRRLAAALAAEHAPSLSHAFRSERSSLQLPMSLRLRVVLGIAILALMTTKPGAPGAWLLLLAAGIGGLAACAPLAGRRASLAGAPARRAS